MLVQILFLVRILRSALINFQIYNTVLLTVVTMQYYGAGDGKDREAWRAAVHEAAESDATTEQLNSNKRAVRHISRTSPPPNWKFVPFDLLHAFPPPPSLIATNLLSIKFSVCLIFTHK